MPCPIVPAPTTPIVRIESMEYRPLPPPRRGGEPRAYEIGGWGSRRREVGQGGRRTGADAELGELFDRGDRLHPPPDLLWQRTEAPLEVPQEDSAGLQEGLFGSFLLPPIGPTI